MLKFSLFFVLLLNAVFPQTQNFSELRSAENRKNFGRHLYITKDYLRSAEELKSFLRLQSDDTVRFQMAKSLQKLERFSESADYFKTLFFSDLSNEAKTEFFRSKYLIGNLSDFNFNSQISSYLPDQTIEVDRLKNFSRLMFDESFVDSTELISNFPDTLHGALKTFYFRKNNPEYKSLIKAALLSSIMPGLGKIYADEVGDGITALLVTSLLSFLAYDNFKADHKIRAWIFTGLAAYFYAGNIYGSASAAQYYNAGISFNFENDLKIFLNDHNLFLSEYDCWQK